MKQMLIWIQIHIQNKFKYDMYGNASCRWYDIPWYENKNKHKPKFICILEKKRKYEKQNLKDIKTPNLLGGGNCSILLLFGVSPDSKGKVFILVGAHAHLKWGLRLDILRWRSAFDYLLCWRSQGGQLHHTWSRTRSRRWRGLARDGFLVVHSPAEKKAK